jgi:hypothetical protein
VVVRVPNREGRTALLVGPWNGQVGCMDDAIWIFIGTIVIAVIAILVTRGRAGG